MALMDFIKKQFIDIIQWTEEGDGTLAWRFPMAGMEIQNGGTLVVRESQMAIFVNEGQVADVFGPGTYKLTTQTLPVLTYLKNWDKLFESPFKSDVYFFSTRQQIDQKWGTPQTITIRDLAANQVMFAEAMVKELAPIFAKLGILIESLTVQNVSLPEELQKILDQKIGMGMVGNDMAKFMQYQTAQAIPKFAEASGGGGGIAGDAMGLGAGVALGQVLAQNLQQGLQTPVAPAAAAAAQAAATTVGVKPEEVMATLEKLGELKSKGILTQEEFDAKKAELLKKLV